MPKVVLCMVPWVCSIIATDKTTVAPDPASQRRPPSVALGHPETEESCQEPHHCSLPPETASRVVRLSYVREIIRAADDL
ncbi:MAG TPA: hypothetical protein VF103_11695 [Polyangiaceae bacterium]